MFDDFEPFGDKHNDPLGEDALEGRRKAQVQEVFDAMRLMNLLSLREWNSVSAAWKQAEKERTKATAADPFEFPPGFALPLNDAPLRSVAELGDSIWEVVVRAVTPWDVRKLMPVWAEEVQAIFGTAAFMAWVDKARSLGVPYEGEHGPR